MRVIKDARIMEDDWQLVKPAEEGKEITVPEGRVIVPYQYWKANRQAMLDRGTAFGVCIAGDDPIEEVAEDLKHFAIIALDFPAFKDGRNYSHARLLRDRYKYTGELRAVGDILRDQLFYLHRCGIDSFCVREDKDIEDALKGLMDFSVTYQTAADGAVPVYKNR